MKHRNNRRTALLKGHVTNDEKDAFRRACANVGRSCSDVIREAVLSKIQANDKPAFQSRDRPKFAEHRAQFFPSRHVSYGATPRARYLV